ncbi:sulfurtransferase [Mucor ambiguus]|uniref:Sulfurtransferase n=1 Tax=Mucor ambiguus TaxID=91626 RepID=A0A0C9M3W7_9FUNG|nr:sulfurtransferase [Mucor ambiguus]
MFRRLFSQQSTLLRKTVRNKTFALLPKALAPTALQYIMSSSSDMPSLQPANAFSTTSALERNFPVSKIENYDSSTYKTLAFYKFYPLTKPELEALKEKLLADFGELGIVGRIYISTEGINAQIACPEECLPKLQAYHDEYLKPMFDGDLMDLNIGTEHGKRSFRALHVRIRKQLIADGLDPGTYDLNNVPSHLSPAEWHEKLTTYEEKHGKKPILIDMRNHYESKIGFFDGAICPDADTYKDSITAMNEICDNLPRGQEIFMYCTGGIRCTKAGAILQSASGFDTVHLVEGGITSYGRWIEEQEDKESLFRGKNFTFDARMGEKITDELLGKCQLCGEPCNRYQNCSHASCNILMLCCPSCASQFLNTCARLQCYDTVHEFMDSTQEHYHPAGPVLVDGVRAFTKQGEKNMDATSDRVVIGKKGVSCDHEHTRRTRAIEVLGEPGEVLKEWAKAGRDLPPKPSTDINA